MTKNEKVIARLESMDIYARTNNETVYVFINDTELELSQFEVDYQARCYDEEEEVCLNIT